MCLVIKNKIKYLCSISIAGFIIISLATNSVFAMKDDVLSTSWEFYKNVFINQDGRVIDYEKGFITTSEGQSYALLRALVMKDKRTFDKVYKWTKNNLKRQDDNLFAWLWGLKSDGTYGKIDENSASDADIDIAFALIMASKVWGKNHYLVDARKILFDIWHKETIDIKGQRILVAGVEQKNAEDIDVNPSYFAPYAFKVFAKYDKVNDWNKLVDSSYTLINTVTNMTKTHLPPDWFTVNKETGNIYVDTASSKSDFSYDAVRTFFRFYLDYQFNDEVRARDFLLNIKFLVDKWKNNKNFYTNYKQDGELRDQNQSIGSILLLVPPVSVYDKGVAKDIYRNKMKSDYREYGYWGSPYDYYTQNLAWFGSLVYLHESEAKKYFINR